MEARELFRDICNCRYCFSGEAPFGTADQVHYRDPDPEKGQPNEPWLGRLQRSAVWITGTEPTPLDLIEAQNVARQALGDGVCGYFHHLEDALINRTFNDSVLRKLERFSAVLGGMDLVAVTNLVRCRRKSKETNRLSLEIRQACMSKHFWRTMEVGHPNVIVLHDADAQVAFLEKHRHRLPEEVVRDLEEHRLKAHKCWHPGAKRGFVFTPDVSDELPRKPGFNVVLLPHFVYIDNGLLHRAAVRIKDLCTHEYECASSDWVWRVEPIH